MKKLIYFAYGSNMEPTQMIKRLGRDIKPHGAARLDGYRFGYWGHSIIWALAGTADITPAGSASEYVLGVAYELNSGDFEELDKYEHVINGRYKRQLLNVLLGDKLIPAFAYTLRRDGTWQYPEDENEPLPRYVRQCATAARNMNMPRAYINKYILQKNKTE